MINDCGNILLYAADINALSNGRVFRFAYQTVSEERRKKTDRLHFAKDKYLSLGAELLLKKTLSDFGAEIDEFKTVPGENGKPYLPGQKDVFFNLSHSEEYVLCAVANTEIGCDIEKIKEYKESLAKRCFSQREFADIVSKSSQEEKKAAFFRYWTLRESYAKYTGLGLTLPFSDWEITDKNGVGVLQNGVLQSVFFKEFNELPGYACAVCANMPLNDTQLSLFHLTDIL